MKDERYHNKRMAFFMGGLVCFMVGMSFAAVPLYRIFCQQTGYGGTPKLIYTIAPSKLTSGKKKPIKIRFNADLHRHLPWSFQPLQTEITVQTGVQATAFYEVVNKTDRTMIGIASYNVTPDKAGPYFNKIACFCFEEQRIPPKVPITMPVQFIIDPDIFQHHPDIQTITLSYTFFEVSDFKGYRP